VTNLTAWKEADRLKAVESYGILDTPREKDFDDLAKLASELLDMPISAVTFLMTERQWFKAQVGLGEMTQTRRDISICTHAIQQSSPVFVVPDTTKDTRFQENPLVTGDPHVRFYAGALLETDEGLPLGTICVLDYKPREFTPKQEFVLRTLARQVMAQLELRRTLREKEKSQERLRVALDASGFIGTWDWDIPSDRVVADPRLIALFGGEAGWGREGVRPGEYLKSFHPGDVARVKAAFNAAIGTGEPFHEEYRVIRKDGEIRWLDARGRTRFDASGKAIRFAGAAVDVTERKASEQAADEASNRFRLLAEAMEEKIYTASPAGQIEYYSHQWSEFSGVPHEELAEKGWSSTMHPDDLADVSRRWKEAFAHGTAFEAEMRLRNREGAYRWHLNRAHPVRDAEDRIVRWIGWSTDVDDQRRFRERLEGMVQERTNKLKASVAELEAFSYSISHDMRAPLRAMLGFSEILQEEYGPQLDEQANRFLSRIRAASKRMDSLIQDVLSFSRMGRIEVPLEPVDTLAVIREIVESYPNLRTSEIGILLPKAMPRILANQAALTQCVSNILGNAVKFVAPGVKPVVRVWAEGKGDRVRIWFKDNGIGIEEKDYPRIFEIFQRLDRTHEGTGIGLAIVKKAAQRMGGSVGLESTPGQGSSFWLDLQAA
jgi:PAS domain S-box-containing protein